MMAVNLLLRILLRWHYDHHQKGQLMQLSTDFLKCIFSHYLQLRVPHSQSSPQGVILVCG